MPYSAVSLTLPTLHIYAIDYDIAIARQEELQTFQKGLDARNEQRKSAGLPSLSEVVTTIHRNTFLLHHNQALIDHIQANVAAHPGDIHKLVSFSNRGSYEIDQVNRGAHSIDSGSSFDFMPQLAEACGVDFEPIFMADVFADLPFGSTFQRATMPDFKGEHLRCPMDSKKISTTYLHTQHFANLYPGSTVHYYPYDDSAIKNRFGAVNELGVFAMTDRGLKEVGNPSAIFLSRQVDPAPGNVTMVTWEGTRPILVEIQALVDEAHGQAKRLTAGLETNRLSILLAVLHRHGGVVTYDQDVFVNVVGGVKVSETASDLSLLMAIVSSLRNRVFDAKTVVFGEIGLAGEIRPVQYGQDRLKEAAKHGFVRAIVPSANVPKQPIEGLDVKGVESLRQALEEI